MKRNGVIYLAALLTMSSGPVMAQNTVNFGPLERLVGACWQAELPRSDDEKPEEGEAAPVTIDTHCFSRMFNGAYVKDDHVVRASDNPPIHGETVYAPLSNGDFKLTHMSDVGGIRHSTVERVSDQEIIFLQDDDKRRRSRLVLTDQGYDMINEERSGGRWVTGSTLSFKRIVNK